MKMNLLIVSVSLFLGFAANAASLKFSVSCFSGKEQLEDGKRNMLAVCLKGKKILLSEEANGDHLLDIVEGEDGRISDGNLQVVLSNGDKFIVTAGFNPEMKVDYLLIRGDKKINLEPAVQVQLKK